MESIFEEIKAERDRQDKQWGGPDHDDTHTQENWEGYIIAFAEGYRGGNYRQRLVAIAALAVAAIQSHDRINAK